MDDAGICVDPTLGTFHVVPQLLLTGPQLLSAHWSDCNCMYVKDRGTETVPKVWYWRLADFA